MKRDFSECRSNGYQWVIMEQTTEPQTLTDFSDAEGFSGRMHDEHYNEKIHEINEQLNKAYWRLINEHLTDRQREVIELYSKGLTQVEISRILGINQSSIVKSIRGNQSNPTKSTVDGQKNHKEKNDRKTYGGSSKKMRKVASTDPEVQNLLAQLKEIISNE